MSQRKKQRKSRKASLLYRKTVHPKMRTKEAAGMEYYGTLSSAKAWAESGKLEEWLHAYLLSDGNNKPFSDGLKIMKRRFLGPLIMPVSLFQRCYGPEENMQYRVDEQWWEKNAAKLQAAIFNACDVPPLIVHYVIPEGCKEGVFELNDGNKRWEACKRLGVSNAPVIVWMTENFEYEQFCKQYHPYLLK